MESSLKNDSENTAHLVFLEFVDEAEVFLKSYLEKIKTHPQDYKIISFHPSIKAFLSKNQIDGLDSFLFCPTSSHQKLLGTLADFAKQIRALGPLEDERGVKESYTENLLHPLFQILSSWLYRVEVISNAIDYFQPKIVVSVGPEKLKIVRSMWNESVERFTPEIIQQICFMKKIIYQRLLNEINPEIFKWRILPPLKRIVRNIVSNILGPLIKPNPRFILLSSDSFNMNLVIKDLWKDLKGKYDLILLRRSHRINLKDVKESFFERGKRSYHLLFYDFDKPHLKDSAFFEQKKIFRQKVFNLIDQWNYKGVSPNQWLRSKYTIGLEPETLDLTYYQSINLHKFLDNLRPVLVLSQYSRGMTAVLGELCRNKKIPSMIIPHGSFTEITDPYSKLDWQENAKGMVNTHYQYIALQTPLIKKFLLTLPPENSHEIITGPLILGRKLGEQDMNAQLKKKFAPMGEKIFLYANTPKCRRGQRFITYETIDEYIDGLVAMVKAVDQLQGVHLVIRHRPIEDLNGDGLKNLLPESKSFSIESQGSFLEYLSVADLLVSFSSSTMEEALQNNIPVLQFNKYNRYQHLKGQELKEGVNDIIPSAVYNVNSKADLLFALEWILKNHLANKALNDHLFEQYQYKSHQVVLLSKFIKDIDQQNLTSFQQGKSRHDFSIIDR